MASVALVIGCLAGSFVLPRFLKSKNGMSHNERVVCTGLGGYLILHTGEILREQQIFRSWKCRNKADLLLTSLAASGLMISGTALTHRGVTADPRLIQRLLS